ncbi:MAG: GyrI-like domain-containing protein [Opitutaceae bacterium]
MPKLDLRRAWPALYRPGRQPHVVQVPPLRYLGVDGRGAPGCAAFQAAIEALFTASYHARFALKKQGVDYAVMPLEGLWWADDMGVFLRSEREQWRWTLLIAQPDCVPTTALAEARAAASAKLGASAAALRVIELHEGTCAQALHVGPFSEEGPLVAQLHRLIAASGGRLDRPEQKHHEIYLSDFRRTRPERLRTIVRQPFTS